MARTCLMARRRLMPTVRVSTTGPGRRPYTATSGRLPGLSRGSSRAACRFLTTSLPRSVQGGLTAWLDGRWGWGRVARAGDRGGVAASPVGRSRFECTRLARDDGRPEVRVAGRPVRPGGHVACRAAPTNLPFAVACRRRSRPEESRAPEIPRPERRPRWLVTPMVSARAFHAVGRIDAKSRAWARWCED